MRATLRVGVRTRIAALEKLRNSGFSFVRLILYSQSGVPVFLEITDIGWEANPISREINQNGDGFMLGIDDVDIKLYHGDSAEQTVYYWLQGVGVCNE